MVLLHPSSSFLVSWPQISLEKANATRVNWVIFLLLNSSIWHHLSCYNGVHAPSLMQGNSAVCTPGCSCSSQSLLQPSCPFLLHQRLPLQQVTQVGQGMCPAVPFLTSRFGPFHSALTFLFSQQASRTVTTAHIAPAPSLPLSLSTLHSRFSFDHSPSPEDQQWASPFSLELCFSSFT